MELAMYQVDAFSNRVFGGNPAAVCPLEVWLPDEVMVAIAAENNLAETAFFVREGDSFRLRWFTPVAEVDLCGHATLASAYVLFEVLDYREPIIRFETRSGPLHVERRGDLFRMDFPATVPIECDAPEALLSGLGLRPQRVLKGFDYIAHYASEGAVRSIKPDFKRLAELDLRGVCITAPGEKCDFVSRFFAPGLGINEDPVTGSAHCELAPLWAAILNKTTLQATQLSPRTGLILCELKADRVLLSGHATLYMTAKITIA